MCVPVESQLAIGMKPGISSLKIIVKKSKSMNKNNFMLDVNAIFYVTINV